MTDEATPTPTPAPPETLEPPEERPLSPLAAFAEKHRFILGLTIAAVMAAVGVWAGATFVPENPIPGAFGVIQRYAFPAMCTLIAVVGTTWALRVPRIWTNIAAYAAIGTYLVYILSGWIYEQFLA